MAAPSFAEWWSQYTNFCRLVVTLYNNANTDSANWLGSLDTFEQSMEGDYILEVIQGVRAGTLTLNAVFDALLPAFDGLLLTLGKVIAESRRDTAVIPESAYNYFIDNSLTVLQMNYTRGSLSNSGNVGTGTVYQLTTDDENYAIEDGAGYKSSSIVTYLRCIADKTSGALAGAEAFRVYTAVSPNPNYPNIDKVGGAGTGRELIVRSLCVDDATEYIENPGFQDYNSNNTDPFPGWLSTSGTTYTGVTQSTSSTYGYRPTRESLSKQTREYYSVAIANTASTGLKQFIGIGGKRQIDFSRPFLVAITFKGDGSADGNLVLKLGDYDGSPLSISTAVSSSYQTVLINGSTARNAWPRRFNQDDLSVAFERASHSAGVVYVSQVLVAPYDYFLGRFFKVVAGPVDWSAGAAGSPNKRGDIVSFSDSLPSSIGTSQWVWRVMTGGAYLPHADVNSATQSDFS